MNTMFQVDDYFARIRDKGDRLKLTVWRKSGEKIVSEFITADPSSKFWSQMAKLSSDEVVSDVRKRLYG